MILKVIVDTFKTASSAAAAITLAIIGLVVFVTIADAIGSALHIGGAVVFCVFLMIIVGWYVGMRAYHALPFDRAAEIVAKNPDNPVAKRMKIVLDRFHDDCYVGSELERDSQLLRYMIRAYEGGHV